MADAVSLDQHHRERIRTAHHETLFVEAGAGTGKTTALIDRLVELAGVGVPLSSVAAITFTEAAAAELRDRLRFELDRRLADDPANEAWARALEELDGAAIQTLHGFAQRLLSLYPLEAGLPPGFTVRDEPAARAAFDERFDQFLDAFLGEDGPADLVEMLEGFGCMRKVREIAWALHGSWDRVSHPSGPLREPPRSRAEDIASAFETAVSIEPEAKSPDDLFLGLIADYRERIPRYRAARDHFELCQLTRESLPYHRGQAPNWPRGVLKSAKDALKEARSIQDAWFHDYGRYMSEHLVAHLSGFVLEYAEERRREGTLEFHDLLVLARDLLANPDNGTVRGALHQRFTHILIDEFQDTDPLQVELATRIARDPATPAETPWHASEVPPGSVFVVGDPRQSIYRFRRADIALYSRARGALGADHVTLSRNFRSRPGIIEWVNETFSQLLAAAPDPVTTVPYTGLEHSREHAAPAPVMHIGGKVEGTASAWRRQQGDDIARTIAWILGHGHAHGIIRDDESGDPVQPSDIAILFRTRTGVASLEQALEEAGIPYRVESRSLIYQTQEIADLANILAALADPTNEVAVVAALRSPAFACTDRELLDFRRAGGRWSYLADPPDGLEATHPVVAGLRWLADAHARVAAIPVNEAVELVIRERRMMELAYAFRRPREHWQRYRYVLDQARAFAAEPGASLRRFVAWVRRQQDENNSVLESAAPQSDDEAVRLMTVHAAKGLEFPVVIMTGLGTGAKKSTPTVVWDHDGQSHVRLKSGDRWLGCDGYEDAAAGEKQAAAAEEARILYVAATRARELLVLALHRNNDDTNAGRLAEFAGDANCPPIPLEELGDAPVEAPAAGQPPPGDAWLEERGRWIARRQQRITESAYGNAIAATRVARGVPLGEEASEDGASEGAPWKRGRAGTSLGRAVHAALQVVDFDDPTSLAEVARAQAIAEGIAGREDEVESLVRAVLGSTAVQEARASRHWREIFVSTPLERHLLEGFIDLLYERDGGLVVVDYKTDALRTDAEIDAAVERYRLQLAAYALALSAQLGRPITECRFVFASEQRRMAERVIDDPAAAMDQVRETLRDWPSTPPGGADTLAAAPRRSNHI